MLVILGLNCDLLYSWILRNPFFYRVFLTRNAWRITAHYSMLFLLYTLFFTQGLCFKMLFMHYLMIISGVWGLVVTLVGSPLMYRCDTMAALQGSTFLTKKRAVTILITHRQVSVADWRKMRGWLWCVLFCLCLKAVFIDRMCFLKNYF